MTEPEGRRRSLGLETDFTLEPGQVGGGWYLGSAVLGAPELLNLVPGLFYLYLVSLS